MDSLCLGRFLLTAVEVNLESPSIKRFAPVHLGIPDWERSPVMHCDNNTLCSLSCHLPSSKSNDYSCCHVFIIPLSHSMVSSVRTKTAPAELTVICTA